MTAEVAVINLGGIALAADSAVTFGAGGESKKSFTHSNKIFELSKTQPIGIMIYGNAYFGRLPLEALIKEFRKASSRRDYPTVEACADHFIEFLSDDKFLETVDDTLNTLSAFTQVLTDLIEGCIAVAKGSDKRALTETVGNMILAQRAEVLSSSGLFEPLEVGEYFPSAVVDDYVEFANKYCSDVWRAKETEGQELLQMVLTEKSTVKAILQSCVFIQSRPIVLELLY